MTSENKVSAELWMKNRRAGRPGRLLPEDSDSDLFIAETLIQVLVTVAGGEPGGD